MAARPLLLDVDTGVDDALAIILALRSPEIEVRGISTVSGNAPVDQTTRNTLLVLDLMGAQAIPVVSGAADPLRGAPLRAAEVHGSDGLGNVSRQFPVPARRADSGAVDFLLRAIRRWPGELTLVATAPLTNVAMAVQRDPQTMRLLGGLTIMGGAVRVPGNVSPLAEFNFAADPDAAAAVLAAGLPVRLIPLDVTEQVVLSRTVVEAAAGKSPLAAFIGSMTRATFDFHRDKEGLEGMFLHDPLAVASVVDPSLVRYEPMPVAVERRGELTAGMVVVDRRRRSRPAATAEVAVEVDALRMLQLFTRRVLGCGGPEPVPPAATPA